jgi:outer membrane receptor protein involved in Fe transport
MNVRYALPWDTDVRVGVNNIFNEARRPTAARLKPTTRPPTTPSGRYYSFSVTKRF